MKVYSFSFVGTHSNDLSYGFDRMPTVLVCNQKELKDAFKYIRIILNKNFKKKLKGNLKSYSGFKYGFKLAIVDVKKDEARFKEFYINPLNLK